MTINSEPSNDLEEIRCECGFPVGFGPSGTKITCVYCKSEWEFFRNEFSHISERETSYIYETIPTDKSPWRRGLMHDRKNAIRTWYEVLKDKEK